jgi:hypothetical protein
VRRVTDRHARPRAPTSFAPTSISSNARSARDGFRFIETVVEKGAARQVLERLGFSVDAPRLVRARDPTTLDGDEPDAA